MNVQKKTGRVRHINFLQQNNKQNIWDYCFYWNLFQKEKAKQLKILVSHYLIGS